MSCRRPRLDFQCNAVDQHRQSHWVNMKKRGSVAIKYVVHSGAAHDACHLCQIVTTPAISYFPAATEKLALNGVIIFVYCLDFFCAEHGIHAREFFFVTLKPLIPRYGIKT